MQTFVTVIYFFGTVLLFKIIDKEMTMNKVNEIMMYLLPIPKL